MMMYFDDVRAVQDSNLSLCLGERRCTSAAFRPSELTALKSCPIFTDGATWITYNYDSFSLWKLLCKQTADGAGLEPASLLARQAAFSLLNWPS